MLDLEEETTIDTPTSDKRIRHYVERLSPNGVLPAVYSKVALCGEKVEELTPIHNGKICQKCVDESRRRPVER